MIDTIILHGQGTTESLKVAGKPPGQGSSLRFKMTEALLKDCTESEPFNRVLQNKYIFFIYSNWGYIIELLPQSHIEMIEQH